MKTNFQFKTILAFFCILLVTKSYSQQKTVNHSAVIPANELVAVIPASDAGYFNATTFEWEITNVADMAQINKIAALVGKGTTGSFKTVKGVALANGKFAVHIESAKVLDMKYYFSKLVGAGVKYGMLDGAPVNLSSY